MTIKKNKSFNSYDLKGLTAGKLLAILNALQTLEAEGQLTIVAADVLNLLEREKSTFDPK